MTIHSQRLDFVVLWSATFFSLEVIHLLYACKWCKGTVRGRGKNKQEMHDSHFSTSVDTQGDVVSLNYIFRISFQIAGWNIICNHAVQYSLCVRINLGLIMSVHMCDCVKKSYRQRSRGSEVILYLFLQQNEKRNSIVKKIPLWTLRDVLHFLCISSTSMHHLMIMFVDL